ncbi:type III secretion system chaperone [Halodesulfovibrio sp. MK-HDV]|jgi:Tir chaperone family protein CesT|uniref:type III secretion system chaperone n=1 Tax=Halodesulfovibrio sp. MK-HDV TaxID=2599925 RepID=UPI0013682F32|nr:type III secretion system chaperone [Halodesulfovibrio sp. MK-HDV]KAF1077080.1 hypothetical protein MKHDV_00677 [Halodesulfovibrio sp. MK-HDV]
MEYKNTLRNLLTEFAENIDHGPLTFDESGYSRITIKGNLSVRLDIDEANGSLQLVTIVSPDNPEIYADLLEINAFRNQLAGARFVLLREEGNIALLKHVEIEDLTLQKFELIFTEFLAIAQKWTETLALRDPEEIDDSDKTQPLEMDDVFNRA